MDNERKLKEKLLKLFEETDRRSEEQEACIQELRQKLSLAEKVCFEANGFLKSSGTALVRIYLERLEDAVKKWDSSRESRQDILLQVHARGWEDKDCWSEAER